LSRSTASASRTALFRSRASTFMTGAEGNAAAWGDVPASPSRRGRRPTRDCRGVRRRLRPSALGLVLAVARLLLARAIPPPQLHHSATGRIPRARAEALGRRSLVDLLARLARPVPEVEAARDREHDEQHEQGGGHW